MITKTVVTSSASAPATPAAQPSVAEVAAQIDAANSEVASAPVAPTEESSVAAPEAEEASEIAAEIVTPTAPVKDAASARFAALSKKEKAVREAQARAEEAAKTREQQFKQRELDLERRAKETAEREERFNKASHPIEVLKAKGLSYADATEAMLGNYKSPEVDPIDQKLTPVQEHLAKLAKENEELRALVNEDRARVKQKEDQQRYREFIDAVKGTIAAGLEKYELTAALGDDAIDIVRETMIQCYQKNGVTPGYEDACEMVEEYLENTYVARFEKTKKLQSRFNKPAVTPPQTAVKPKPNTPKTLTNDMGATGTATDDTDKMSRSELLKYLEKKYS